MLQAYPGRGNPVLDALRGKLSIRTLRVMLEGLPPDNPASRELNGHPLSQGDVFGLHTVNGIQSMLAQNANLWREKGKPPVKPDLIPTPWDNEDDDGRTEEQIQAERDHLQSVLNRPDPR